MSQFMKSMCKIAIPVTLQSMLQASFSIVDQLMIGQLGETNIAAVGICGNYSMLVSVLLSAVGAVAGILIAQFLGAEDRREAWSSFTVSMILCGMAQMPGARHGNAGGIFMCGSGQHGGELYSDLWENGSTRTGDHRCRNSHADFTAAESVDPCCLLHRMPAQGCGPDAVVSAF